VRARAVVSNADPHQAFGSLMPPEAVPEIYRLKLRAVRPSLSCFVFFLALDTPPSALGLPYHGHQVSSFLDPAQSYRAALAGDLEHTDWLVSNYEHVDPDLMPEGRHALVLGELMPGGPWQTMAPDAYKDEKARAAERLLAKYERRFPGLRAHIAEMEVGTPQTMQRYTLNTDGAMYGADGTTLNKRTPVRAFYLTGSWSVGGGGYMGAVFSALQTADVVLQDLETPNTVRLHLLKPDDDAFLYRTRIYIEDTDLFGVAHHSALVRVLDRARFEAMEALWGPAQLQRMVAERPLTLYKLELHFKRRVPLGERLEVRTQLSLASSVRVLSEQIVLGEKGDVVLQARADVVCVDETGGVTELPTPLIEALRARGT